MPGNPADDGLWHAAVARVRAEFSALPLPVRQQIAALTAEITSLKSEHQRIVASADAQAVCTRCKGSCCNFGRHHFTVIELLVFLTAEVELFMPDFHSQVCPYHSGSACLMEPALRPFNCIIFICEELEERLDEGAKSSLALIESRLRMINRSFDQLLGNRFENGLLLTFQRALDSGRPLFIF